MRAPSAAAPHAARTSSSGDLPPEDFGLRVTGAVSSTLDMIRLEDFFVNEASKVSGRCGGLCGTAQIVMMMTRQNSQIAKRWCGFYFHGNCNTLSPKLLRAPCPSALL